MKTKVKIIAVVSTLLVCMTFSPVTSFASTELSTLETMSKNELIETYKDIFLEGGFDFASLEYYDEVELQMIIESRGTFEGSTTSHTLFVNEYEEDKPQTEGNLIASYSFTLSNEEFNLVNSSLNNKNKVAIELLKEKIYAGKAEYCPNPNKLYLSTRAVAPTQTNNIDSGVITTKVSSYVTNTSTHTRKGIVFEFEWGENDKMPITCGEDAIAVYHNGGELGMTGSYGRGGTLYMKTTGWDAFTSYANPAVDWNNFGYTSTADLGGALKNYWTVKGRYYEIIGNTNANVSKGADFHVKGQYAHKGVFGYITASVGVSGITFTPHAVATYTKTTPAEMNVTI